MTKPSTFPAALWDVILHWGVGWTVGSIVYFVGFFLLVRERMLPLAFVLIGLAGGCAFGLPAISAARRRRSRDPLLQGAAWTVSFFIAMSVVALAFAKPHQLARPGDVNINTFQTMQERQESFDRWGHPPEAVARWKFLIVVVASFAFVGAASSALVARSWRSAYGWFNVVVFGLAASVGVVIGACVALLMFATYLLLPVAGLGGGCAAGTVIEHARRWLLPSGQPGAREA